jgi:hypothetical protein
MEFFSCMGVVGVSRLLKEDVRDRELKCTRDEQEPRVSNAALGFELLALQRYCLRGGDAELRDGITVGKAGQGGRGCFMLDSMLETLKELRVRLRVCVGQLVGGRTVIC